MRGKVMALPSKGKKVRITPRTCGEKDWLTKLWGMGHGITPAHAGKRSVGGIDIKRV